MISANLSAVFYLISGVLFILALRGLSSPETSRQGNFFGIMGMIIAISVTFLSIGNFSTGFILLERNISSLEQFSLGDADLHLNPLPPLVPAWQLFCVLCFRWFEKTSSNFPYRRPS